MAIPSSGYLTEDNWRLAGAGVQVGESVGGDAQIVAGPTPWWVCSLTYVVPRAAHLEWEAWIEGMRGQLITEDVTPLSSRTLSGDGRAWTGGVLWTGGVSWSATLPRVKAAASQFAGSITVDDVSDFQIGRFFFINGHCYRTVSVSGSVVNFRPGLRKAVNLNTQILGVGTVPMYSAQADFPEFARTASGAATITLRMKERVNNAN